MHPFRRSVGPVFLFPNWHNKFELINRMTAGLEGLVAMRAAHGHRHADLSDFEMAQPMDHHDFTDRPAVADVSFDLGHFFLGHGRVRFIVESGRGSTVGQVADRAEKSHDSAAPRPAHLFGQAIIINRFMSQADHELKSEIRSTKSETNSKLETPNSRNSQF